MTGAHAHENAVAVQGEYTMSADERFAGIRDLR
jgi:hypothetical protein